MLRERCHNDNHGRAVVTVRFCPNCGAVVNERILAKRCPPEKHARMRRSRSTYCVDCGQGLVREGAGR
jgi:predicted RNA-binding Zn-ribbon protein involved in translation (DUF1610 family)